MNNRYLYDKIYQKILKDIENGVYKVGDKLPTEKELSLKYNVSRITSQRAMKELVENNIVDRHPGLGSFVSDRASQSIGQVALLSEPTCIIGLVVEAIWPSYGIDLFDAIYEKALEFGYHLVVKKSYGHQDMELQAIKELMQMGAKGILLMPAHGTNYSEDILKLVLDKYPIVLIDRYLNGIPVPFVGSDNIHGVMSAYEYLQSIGHKNIGYITSEEGQATAIDERKQGYIKACIEAKSQLYLYENAKCVILSSYDPSDNEAVLQELEQYILMNVGVTAYIVSEYYLAKMMKLAIKKIGMRMPEDISVICFDSPSNYANVYEYTHVRQNETEIGYLAMQHLHDVISGNMKDDRVFVETSIMIGDSTIVQGN